MGHPVEIWFWGPTNPTFLYNVTLYSFWFWRNPKIDTVTHLHDDGNSPSKIVTYMMKEIPPLKLYILSKKFIIAPKHNKHVVKREEPSPDSRTGGYCKMVPIGRNDLKFFIQGAFAHLY